MIVLLHIELIELMWSFFFKMTSFLSWTYDVEDVDVEAATDRVHVDSETRAPNHQHRSHTGAQSVFFISFFLKV